MVKINAERLLAALDEQAAIGRTPDGGLSRTSLSDADLDVRAWFAERARSGGLMVRTDGAGNQHAVFASPRPAAPTVLIGSHLDSVPNGGRFDGALGVVAGLEVALTLADVRAELPFHVEVVNFTDEEGTRLGLLGSTAMCGMLTSETLDRVRMGRAELDAALERVGCSCDTALSARRDFSDVLAYFEAHIEQGTRLERAGDDIGVVTAIVGIHSFWLTFGGQAAHAGTRPIPDRRDAFMGAAQFAQGARQLVLERFSPGVCNVGAVQVEPGAFNIVPASARIAFEFRHGDPATLGAMEEALLALARQAADDHGLTLEITPAGGAEPALMDSRLVDIVERAAEQAGLKRQRLMSFAGHDAQMLARVTPSVMLFVPCKDGISHNPAEYCAPEDCVNAAQVILNSVLLLAGSDSGAGARASR
ncbi:MAG: Zn-dependent hydrolase [Chloroflexi bacterium]|nr:Zn-dependent hydrolase [Chloroflexota bacterium]MBV6435303.1 N-carbamoyl-L-amino-acid hydrolase [Anaerolineae bacterium]